MKTRCPFCKLVYNIQSSTLKDADFKVVCSECHHVFRIKEKKRPKDRKAKRRKTSKTGSDIDLMPDAEMQGLLEDLQQSLDKQENKQADAVAAQNKQKQADSDNRSVTVFSEQAEENASKPSPPVDKAEEEPFLPEFSRQKKPASWFSVLSLFVLLLTALAQLAWIERDQLLQLPKFRTLATGLCPYLGCTLPQPKGEASFTVVDRSLVAHDQPQGAYRLNILLRNDSSSARGLPALRLSLLDEKQITLARRTFPAAIYLGTDDSAQPGRQLKAGELLEIQLLLLAPEESISGFELDFIPAESS